ncbi:unnamed protein product [Brachionus calyciflorus]|uniref:C2 domain-containing protein n=1 Tax=Brachionus calyciflorus TaxID=104777 RepID=A0A813YV55_9BILA|nr:unnamed protein product [Brachionus calyciflorus]
MSSSVLNEQATSMEVTDSISNEEKINTQSNTPTSSTFTIATLLTGLDYIFYVWTIFLVAIVTYLSIYKYYQSQQRNKNKKIIKNNTPPVILTYLILVLKLIFNFLIFLFKNLKKFLLNHNENNLNVKRNYSNIALSSHDSLVCLNNCLKWFYFNSETTKKINRTILNLLNSGNHKPSHSVDAKYDDIYFKSVDTLPPKFTNIQTVVSDNENLTLKSNVEFKNIDVKAELKRSHRQIDFNVLTASGQAMIVLGQSINSAYVLDCSIDPQSELHIEIKKDQNIEQSLVQFLENVLKNSIKQFVLNLELNFQNKKLTGSTRMNMQHLSPQSNISSPNQTLSTSSSNIGQSPSSSNSSPEPTKTNSDSLNASQVRNNANEKRLLVKLIKANNLANCEEPYCVVELDYPMQKHLTDVHRDYSSINEQFLFDITPNSEELSIYVYDRAKDYGNDLIGEAVLPVNDLCSGTSGKRVIQLHRFGSQKTGSLTVEFVFIEPINPRIELRNRSSIASRASRSPYDSVEKQIENKNSFSYKDDMLNEQKLLKTAIDNLSINSLTGPKQNFSPSGLNQNTNIQILNDPTSRHHYIQSNTQNHESQPDTENPISNTSTNGRVINRNYLQIQPSNIKSNTLQSSQLISSIYSDEAFKGVDPDDHKRTRSISRSVKNLFKPKSKKRDKSYDIQTGNQYDVHSVDGENLKKSKSIGGSLKKLFNIKKSSKKYEGSIHNETRPGSPNTISITVSRPSDSNFMGSSHASHLLTPVNSDTTQASFQTKHTNNYGNVTSQLDNSTKQNDESYERKEPLTFKRSLK